MAALTFTNLTRAIEIGANSYCLDLAGKRIVLDAGMHPRVEGEGGLPQYSLLADDSVDGIIVTHAHQDHIGSLPVLMRRQPRARVFMTDGTCQLSDVMLHNSVNVMSRRTEEGTSSGIVFTHREVDIVSKRWSPAPLHTRFDLSGERRNLNDDSELTIEFFDAGHILGSCGALIRGEGRTVFYTGDVNFDDQTVMRAAAFPEEPLDVLIVETTRGDHQTPSGFTRQAEELRFAQAISSALERGGSVLIPLFALGKTQEILAMFLRFIRQKLLKEVPIYIGGLSTKLTEIHDKLAHRAPRHEPDLELLEFPGLFTLSGPEALSVPVRPGRIYALSSGMMTEKTLSNSFARQIVSEPEHSIFFVGYADPDSPAGRLQATRHGEDIQLSPEFAPQPLNCDVQQFSFSGHASRESIRAYINKVRPKTIVLVHGDEPAVAWFKEVLSGDLPESRIVSPPPGEPITL